MLERFSLKGRRLHWFTGLSVTLCLSLAKASANYFRQSSETSPKLLEYWVTQFVAIIVANSSSNAPGCKKKNKNNKIYYSF